MVTGFLWQQLSNLTRTKVDKFVNILNYVSHAKAQDGTEDAQEIKFTKKVWLVLDFISTLSLSQTLNWMYSISIRKYFRKFNTKVHKL